MKSWKNNCKMKENICYIHHISGGASNREPACHCRYKRHGFDPWVRNIPWTRKWQSTPVFLPGESYRQRSLKGYILWGCKRVGHDWSNLAWCTYIIDSSGMNCVITKWIWKNIIIFCSCLWVSIFEQKKKQIQNLSSQNNLVTSGQVYPGYLSVFGGFLISQGFSFASQSIKKTVRAVLH